MEKIMKQSLKPLGLVLALFSQLCLADTYKVTEQNLLVKAKTNNPTLADIEATFLSSKVKEQELADKFGYEFYSGYNYIGTKEKAIISYQPVFSNVNQYKIGVKKYTKYGVVLDANRSVDIRSTDDNYKDISTTTDEFGVQLDLWRDFMGAVSKSQVDNLKDLKKKDELQAKISKKTFEINVRRLYWQLVANEEKLRITRSLFKAAQKQAANARLRKANSISDKAEVARFESLVHQRKGSLLFLEYERELLLKNLRSFFPDLNNYELSLGKYNLSKTVFDVLACSTRIDQQKNVPYEYTDYDEVVSLLQSIKGRQIKIDKTYDSVDLKLDLKFKRTGIASETQDGTVYTGDYAGSIEDMTENDRSGLSAGVMLSVPFGEDKGSTEDVKKLLTEKQFEANIVNLNTNVISTHKQVKKSVKILAEVIKQQKANSKKLEIRVKEMKKKYSQARIPEYALIQDQDSLLQSDLAVVDTQLQVVNTILDYFTIFNQFPCTFNRK
ncbi:MAG: hypothetical protein CME66_11245 [Halobacteriovoraceae bacterium]|jgi:hypothetical protein|nr:hypothetical protein [Halobacteriovoraceae bacterium]